MGAKEFDRIRAISGKLREIFERDEIPRMTGMHDYLVRAVEEATRLTKRAADGATPCAHRYHAADENDFICIDCGARTPRR